MGEAFIVGRGGSTNGGSSNNYKLVTNIFTTNGVFVVPNARNQQFTVRIFGGGGGGGCATSNSNMIAGGGGGFMNNAVLTLEEGKTISVQIGLGGKGANVIADENSYPVTYKGNNGSGGGTTSFGTYLSALGGFGGNSYMIGIGGSGGSGGGCLGRKAGDGYQFGGGGGYGGRGGSYHGGGGAYGAGGDGYGGSGLPSDGSHGGGGGGGYANNKAGNGGNGICIIQYWA